MKSVKSIVIVAIGYLLLAQQAYAQDTDPGGPGGGEPGTAVPEIDGSGAILAVGLVIGLVALFREKFR